MNKLNEMAILAGIVNEAEEKNDLVVFAKKRHAGAEKIANSAKEKGGAALLTYEHFRVKLPYYAKAEKGFDAKAAKAEYVSLCKELHSHMNKIEEMDMDKFQRLLGKMEVIGELLIQDRG
jgi:hypothetical protein